MRGSIWIKKLNFTPAMQSSSHPSPRPVAIWVFVGVFMLLVQVILGGITRLTGSGLSITQWDVVTGVIPPLNPSQWEKAFDGYRQTPQFHILNSDFSLSEYKFIFFWEWFHRLWGRLIGVVFLAGFAWFVWKRQMQTWMMRTLLILFVVGALQGAVGWIMVLSGLTGDAIYVAPAKLALHFVFALGLIVFTFWFALQLSVPDKARLIRSPREPITPVESRLAGRVGLLRRWTIGLLTLLFFQLLYGGLMAGHRAALVAPTWPDINGSLVPESLFTQHPLVHDLVGNRLTVQFIHRTLAYLLFAGVGGWTFVAIRLAPVPAAFRQLRWLPMLFITIQVLLGIASLLTSPGIIPQRWVVFDWLAEMHQVTGLLFLLLMVGMLYLVVPARTSSV